MNIRSATLLVLLAATPAFSNPYSGYVNADGTQHFQSQSYSVVHPGTGRYYLTFGPLKPRANCIVTPVGSATVQVLAEGVHRCDLVFQDLNGVRKDTAFVFIALQMS
jgi:hypothetical protein